MKGELDKADFIFIEAHVEIKCAVCNYVFQDFPATENLIFPCPKCHRLFRLAYAVLPLKKDEVERYTKMNYSQSKRVTQASFNDLPE